MGGVCYNPMSKTARPGTAGTVTLSKTAARRSGGEKGGGGGGALNNSISQNCSLSPFPHVNVFHLFSCFPFFLLPSKWFWPV